MSQEAKWSDCLIRKATQLFRVWHWNMWHCSQSASYTKAGRGVGWALRPEFAKLYFSKPCPSVYSTLTPFPLLLSHSSRFLLTTAYFIPFPLVLPQDPCTYLGTHCCVCSVVLHNYSCPPFVILLLHLVQFSDVTFNPPVTMLLYMNYWNPGVHSFFNCFLIFRHSSGPGHIISGQQILNRNVFFCKKGNWKHKFDRKRLKRVSKMWRADDFFPLCLYFLPPRFFPKTHSCGGLSTNRPIHSTLPWVPYPT